jgi:hypothetical protein
MKDKRLNISKQITSCYEYVDLAERAALNGAATDSNRYWKNATGIALSLLNTNDPGTFLDEEYDFLTQIAKHFKDIDDAPEYY